MTQEQKRIKIAEACGWRNVRMVKPTRGAPEMKHDPIAYGIPPGQKYLCALKDYFSDLNACHEMEKVLKDDAVLWHRYASWIDDNYVNQPYTIGATAAQRAEAFGKTLSLW